MKGMIGLGLAVAAMTTGGAALAQADICADAREVATAARETPPFAPFFTHYPTPQSERRMFGFTDCFYTDIRGEGARFRCRDTSTEMNFSPEDLMSRIAQCLPQAVLTGPVYQLASRHGPVLSERPPITQRPYYRIIYVDSGALRFEFLERHDLRLTNWWLSAYIRD